MAGPEYRWRKKVDESGKKPVSTESIAVGTVYSKANEFKEIDRQVHLTGMENWVNLFVAYRLIPRTGRMVSRPTKPKVSLRKYQHVPEQNAWKRRQNFNVNNAKEAQLVVNYLRRYFPEVV